MSIGDIWQYSFRSMFFANGVSTTYWSWNEIDLDWPIFFLTLRSSFEKPDALSIESISTLSIVVKTVDFLRMPLLGALPVFLFIIPFEETLRLAACFKSLELFIDVLVKLLVVAVVGRELKP